MPVGKRLVAIVVVHPHVSQIKRKTTREMQLKVVEEAGIPALSSHAAPLRYANNTLQKVNQRATK